MPDFALWIGPTPTQVSPNVAATHGTRNAQLIVDEPETEVFMRAKPLRDGSSYLGNVSAPGGRGFTVRVFESGCADKEAAADAAEDLFELMDPEQGLIRYQVRREDDGGTTRHRELLGIITRPPRWEWGRSIYPTLVSWEAQGVAPFPWFREVSPSHSDTINGTGTTPQSGTITRAGSRACGCLIEITTAGTLSSMTLSDGENTPITLSATFSGSALGMDSYHTDPGVRTFDSGVSHAGGHFELHSASTGYTFTPDGGASGSWSVVVTYYPLTAYP